MRIAAIGVGLATVWGAACSPCGDELVLVEESASIAGLTVASAGSRAYVMWSTRPPWDDVGVYVARVPHGQTVRLSSDYAYAVSASWSGDALLACWEGEVTRCAVLDHLLGWRQPAHQVELTALTRIVTHHGRRYAGVAGDFLDESLVEIDERGAPTGAEPLRPCTFSPVVGDRIVGCVHGLGPGTEPCTDGAGNPVPCMVGISVRDRVDGGPVTGNLVLGEGRAPAAAARGDQILVQWDGCGGTCTRLVSADGSLGPLHELPGEPPAWWLVPLADGYLGLSGDYGPPVARRFDRDGLPVGTTQMLDEELAGGYYDPAVAAALGDGYLAAWPAYGESQPVLKARVVCD